MSGGDEVGSESTGHKPHRKSVKGRKAEKKKEKKGTKNEDNVDARVRNPKAFAINSAIRAERKFRRGQDLETRKERVPLVDRTPVEPPPFLVALVGPPKVGKSTLLMNLIRNYTREQMSEVKGPVTIVSGKKRRLTFIECNNDIHSMIDTAKVADLVLLLVDASFGFEMEVFEFLNICQVHGFPQIMGVLTHLDLFKNKKKLKKTKKNLKHRFWTEVYPGSKLFYLSGYFHNSGSYPKNEIHNLARFISVMKFKGTVWRSEHAYVVADRMEDLTPPHLIQQNPKSDRKISLYGWVHGTFLKPNAALHIPGLGDYSPDSVLSLPDPCPLPTKEKTLRRSLNEKEKSIYAPFSGVGGLVYGKDAVYIDLGGSHSHSQLDSNPEKANIFQELLEMKSTLQDKMESASLQLFSRSDVELQSKEVEVVGNEAEDSEGEEEDFEAGCSSGSSESDAEAKTASQLPSKYAAVLCSDGRVRRKVLFEEQVEGASEEEDGEEESSGCEEEAEHRVSLAQAAYLSRFRNRSMQSKIYDENEDFLSVNSRADFDFAGCSVSEQSGAQTEDTLLQALFIGGDYAETAKSILDADDGGQELMGDFEELDRGEGGRGPLDSLQLGEERRAALKRQLKEKFDMEYDQGDQDKSFLKEWKSQVEEQTKLNRTFFESVEDPELLRDLRGFAPGTYVRVEISRVPCEFVVNFDAQRVCPIVVGSLDSSVQETLAVVQARVKKHRWHPKILKTKDPIILSVGWRRFQTIALYSVQDHNMRNRMIKYTPEHLHCIANFYGPMTPQGTGILGIAPSWFDGFRVTLTGTILDMDKSSELVKKLKLIGHPSKIYKKSAFIEGMFTSQLEVAKFSGARIKTVSGIRGVIKKETRNPPGAFRATFEDKILMSDIVFCRTWAKVDVPPFYLNVPTKLTMEPRLMRTVGELKREGNIQVDPNPDHLYSQIERPPRNFQPLKIPRSLQAKLPYKEKPKVSAKLNEPKRVAVIREPHEHQTSRFLRSLKSRVSERETREKLEKARRNAEKEKTMKKLEARQNQRQKLLRKKVFKTLGLMNRKAESRNNSHKGGTPR